VTCFGFFPLSHLQVWPTRRCKGIIYFTFTLYRKLSWQTCTKEVVNIHIKLYCY